MVSYSAGDACRGHEMYHPRCMGFTRHSIPGNLYIIYHAAHRDRDTVHVFVQRHKQITSMDDAYILVQIEPFMFPQQIGTVQTRVEQPKARWIIS